MKTSGALAIGLTVFVLMFVVFCWRRMRLDEEVASVRGTLARTEEAQQAAPTQRAPVALAASPAPPAPVSVPDAGWADRLAAIERDMEEMIASHNQSVDELTRLLARKKSPYAQLGTGAGHRRTRSHAGRRLRHRLGSGRGGWRDRMAPDG
jgi:hypothetical protein